MTMPHFFDTKLITLLRIYPWIFVDNAKSQWDKLVQRGRAVLDFQGCDYKFYDGIALEPRSWWERSQDDERDHPGIFTLPAKKFNVSCHSHPIRLRTIERGMQVVSRIIIDPYLYARSNESFRPQIRSFTNITDAHSRFKSTRSQADLSRTYSELSFDREAETSRMHRLTVKRGPPDKDEQLTNRKDFEGKEKHLFLMSPLLDGFSLNEKQWCE